MEECARLNQSWTAAKKGTHFDNVEDLTLLIYIMEGVVEDPTQSSKKFENARSGQKPVSNHT